VSLNLNHTGEDIAMNRSQPSGLMLAHLNLNNEIMFYHLLNL